MTSAPKSARCCAATGPWNQTVRSTTRMPSSALAMASADRPGVAERGDRVLREPEALGQDRRAVLATRRRHAREACRRVAHEDREPEHGLGPEARVVDLE